MTYKQAVSVFEETILPTVKETYEQDGIVDIPARRECWNDWVDGLCKDGVVTAEQCYDWGVPQLCG